MDYVSHKGGRTCTVTYKDVSVGDRVLRLPVQVQVRRSDNKQLLRVARLMNFQRVDLDKEGVWKAAKQFGGLGSEYAAWVRLADTYLDHTPDLGPLRVDPNNLVFVRGLIAKYPVWERQSPPPPPERPKRKGGRWTLTRKWRCSSWRGDTKPKNKSGRRGRSRSNGGERRWLECPDPSEGEIEPNDARVIRQLVAHYDRVLMPLTPEERTELRTKGGEVERVIPESQREIRELHDKLGEILRYHRHSPLPEDRTPEPDDNDRGLIRQLREHFEPLTQQQDRGLGGQLRALHALTQLDLMLKDYDAFERHVTRYLLMLRDAGLNEMYMAGGRRHIESLVRAGQYEKANRMLTSWADRSAAVNDVDGICRFCSADDGKMSPWAAVQVLDRFLRRSGLSPVQRYEGLALRAIALDKIDRWLADSSTEENESLAAQTRWILKTATRAEIAQRAESAIRQAVLAWEALGEARWTEAKPYSRDQYARAGTEHDGGPRLHASAGDLRPVGPDRPPADRATGPCATFSRGWSIQDDTLMEFRTQESQIMPSRQSNRGRRSRCLRGVDAVISRRKVVSGAGLAAAAMLFRPALGQESREPKREGRERREPPPEVRERMEQSRAFSERMQNASGPEEMRKIMEEQALSTQTERSKDLKGSWASPTLACRFVRSASRDGFDLVQNTRYHPARGPTAEQSPGISGLAR
jgi:hypothetical protein